MKIILKFFITLFMLLLSKSQFAQVGIGTNGPDSSSALEVFSDSKGILMPRLTTIQRDAIAAPANGLMIFNSTTNDSELNIGTPSVANWIGVKTNNYFAQLGIGTEVPDASSALEISSNSKGFLMPRLTTIQRDAIAAPANGLMIFNSTTNDSELNIGTPSVANWIGVKTNNYFAQLGIGTEVPDASSALEISSNSKGFLMPRLTTIQRDAITAPANGLMIFNSTTNDSELNIGTPSVANWIGVKTNNYFAQLGIGTEVPDASSILEISSNSKGFLMPRLTTIQRDAITAPANGLMIFNSTTNDSELNIGTPSVANWIGVKTNNYFAQLGIGTEVPDASSILEISSNSKGFLMPRLTTIQRDSIALPANGLMIFNSTTNDSELNVGTPSVANWIGTKKPAFPMIYSDSGISELITSGAASLAASDLTVSPSKGSFLASFNAQMSGATYTTSSFDSSIGVTHLKNLYNELTAYAGGQPHGLTFGSGETLAPGVYDVAGGPSIAGILTLAGGTATANPIFIIRATGAFTTSVGTKVLLTGNAKPENIYWVCGAAMSTAANTIMKGTMLGGGAGAGAVSLGADSELEGRLFTRLGAITLGANVLINSPIENNPVNLGTLATFAMWSSSGGVSDVATATTNGDAGTAAGVLSMTGMHTGTAYPAGTQGGTVSNISTTTYSIFVNGIEIENSRRTVKLEKSLISLQTMVTVATDNTPVEVRWSVDKGSATLTNRFFSLVRAEH